jgi:rhodanese-related sulfurtransferase
MKTVNELVANAKSQIVEISIDKAKQSITEADLIIDCREAEEYLNGHINGAIHASRGMLEFKLSNVPDHLNRDLKIVIYCKSSGRAALSALSLLEMGYKNVKSISGGIDAWVNAGNPIVK